MSSFSGPRKGSRMHSDTWQQRLHRSKQSCTCTMALARLAGLPALKMPLPTNTPSMPILHHQRCVCRSGHATRCKVDDRQASQVLRLQQTYSDLQVRAAQSTSESFASRAAFACALVMHLTGAASKNRLCLASMRTGPNKTLGDPTNKTSSQCRTSTWDIDIISN